MRILHIVNRLSKWGNGLVNLSIDLAIEQRRAGHTVAFAAVSAGQDDLVRSFGIEIFPLGSEQAPASMPITCIRLRSHLRHFKPDIVHTHTLTGLFIALPWTKLYRIPIVAHLHNVHDAKAHRMGLADRLITVSTAVAETMREHGVPSRKIRVVVNGNLGSPRVPKLSELTPASLHRPAVVTVAGMYHRKGIAELIEAFGTVAETVPDVHLYLVGGGPDKALFQEQATRLPSAQRIHFEDFQPTPQSYMLSSDIFVLASRRDSFGLVLLEAREAGCAIIASDIDGIPEALDHGDAGILVPPHSPEHLAAAMLLLLESPELRKSWQEKAQTDLERFTIARMAREVFTVYEDLLEPAKATR